MAVVGALDFVAELTDVAALRAPSTSHAELPVAITARATFGTTALETAYEGRFAVGIQAAPLAARETRLRGGAAHDNGEHQRCGEESERTNTAKRRAELHPETETRHVSRGKRCFRAGFLRTKVA